MKGGTPKQATAQRPAPRLWFADSTVQKGFVLETQWRYGKIHAKSYHINGQKDCATHETF